MTNIEIRIGNLIKKDNQIISVDEQTIVNMQQRVEEYKPIHIYKSLLYKLGFEENDGFTLKNMKLFLHEGRTLVCFKSKYMHKFEPIAEIRYIHQLQNLYYALTREELIFENIDTQ